MQLELLAPAKNYDQGRAAIDHGADAVYIGAPAYGARSAATNSIADIERLTRYAHLFRCKVFATVNTLLFDNELEDANAMCHRLYEAGCDALIVQDLGLLECDLPPIALHASTQTHNIEPDHIAFLEKAGFERIILARETSLEQMHTIRACCTAELEAFVQGALCVSYSGQCYMSQYLNDRSGNRGRCSQPCRSAYDLTNDKGKILRHNSHLLSLKDFSAAQHIESMADAGITSFKIEGRLKDVSYVKNVTAFYRQLLDNMMERRDDMTSASSGKCTFYFTPDIERSFNRGFTDYFLKKRQPMASFATQKSIGKPVGTLRRKEAGHLILDLAEKSISFHAGDGICFIGQGGTMEGFLVNHADGNTITPNRMPAIDVGTALWRNNDYLFEKQLAGKSAERKIPIDIILSDTSDGFMLTLADLDGYKGEAAVRCEKVEAEKPELAKEQTARQLGKLGNTPFIATTITCPEKTYFVAASIINELRRNAIDKLIETRTQAFAPKARPYVKNNCRYYKTSLDYRANVINTCAKAFYHRHGADVKEWGLERSHDYKGKALMTTRYCLRYELKQCLKHRCNNDVADDYKGTLFLKNQNHTFRLAFDCEKCQMQIFAEN